jgi:hypothetical protein
MRKSFQFYDEFIQNKSILESNVYDHFQEMRFQVDEQREELKKKKDDIALAMIDKIKKSEAMFLNNLKNKFQENFSSFEKSKPLVDELNEIEELFRSPNLLIESIKGMQSKQEESLKDIQLKLNEMNQIKEFCEETNGFQPNLSAFNQEDLFGSLKVNELCSNKNSLMSQILKGEQQCVELLKLCEFSPNDKWSLLYRGTRDGFGSQDFHSKCDGKSNTLTLVKAQQSSYIFGGFTTVEWDSSSIWKSDPNAFLFSLTNKDNKPLKMKIDSNKHQHAIFCHSECGPSYVGGIIIKNNANTTIDSYSNLGFNYKHPQYAYETVEAESFLAGSYKFQLAEIEVYQREENETEN